MSIQTVLKKALGRERLESLARLVGYDTRPWARIVMYEQMDHLLSGLDLPATDCVEISGTRYEGRPFRSYEAQHYPAFDICAGPLPEPVDLIIADLAPVAGADSLTLAACASQPVDEYAIRRLWIRKVHQAQY